MVARWMPTSVVLACLWTTVARAQDPPPAPPTDGEPPTLPEVTVRPPTQPVDDLPFTEPTGATSVFPSLSERSFGQNVDPGFGGSTGILRNSQSLFDSPVAGSIVTRQDLVEKQAADMFHALQNDVGVLMQRTAAGQSSPFIRGLTGQQILILIDGIRLNNSFFRRGPNQYFNTIDPGSIDHIEVLRGQGSVLWGSDAIGGAINVVTRGPDSAFGRQYGDFVGSEFHQTFNTSDSSSYSRVNVEGWIGNSGFFGGGSYMNVRDLDTGFDFGRQPGTNYSQYSGDIKFRSMLSDSEMLTIGLQHFEQEDVPRSDRFPGYPGDRNNSNNAGNARFFDPQQRDLTYIRYEALSPIAAIDAITATVSYHRQREIQTRGIPTHRTQETDVESTGINLVAVRELDGLGKISTGVDWYHDDVDSAFSGTASGVIVPDDAWYERTGAFLTWDVPLTDSIDATAGIRYETIETAGTPIVNIDSGMGPMPTPVRLDEQYDDWVSNIGLIVKMDEGVHVVASISEGFRAPNLDDLMANNPNVLQEGMSVPSLGLGPERSINYEIGLKTNFNRLRTQTFVYWLDIDDNIVSITAMPNTFASDNQDSYVQGVEFDGEYLLTDVWSLYGNFWYTYGRNDVTGGPLSRIPPTQGILGLRWRDRCQRSFFSVYTWLVRRQDRLDPVRDVTDERIPIGGTPGYATLNMRAGHTFGKHDHHRVSLSLENITDKAYLVHGSGVFGTGFTARFGYSHTF